MINSAIILESFRNYPLFSHYNKLYLVFSSFRTKSTPMGSFENNVYHGQHLFLVGRKMKGMDRKTISLLGLVGKNLREEKTNGGNCFPLGLPFFLSPKLEGKMRELCIRPTIFLSLSLLTKQLALISLS